MRAPAFWDRPPSLAASVLGPAGLLYGAIAGRRMLRAGARPPLPVVCVGNFTLGGAGKTPAALAIAALLRELGERPAFLSRGYGGRLPGPVLVDPDRHRAEDVGDEPLLLARAAPTAVAQDRPAGAALCAASGASVVVMDDGLQNPSLEKDLAFAVVDGAAGIGNGLTFPAGPLRAPMAVQWRRVHALVLAGGGPKGEALVREAGGRPVFRARLEPDPAVMIQLSRRRVLAFAGIGRPEKFFETLESGGALIEARRAFPDHHPYTERELARLAREARDAGLTVVTTEKDLVRLRGWPADAAPPIALPVRLAFEDEAGLRELLASVVSRPR